MKLKAIPLLLIIPAAAHAQSSWFQFEAGLGYTHYQTDDGRWYQQGAPIDHLSTSAIALGAGFTGDVWSKGSWGVSYHADYEYMGTTSASCMCTSDANYSRATHSWKGPDDNPTSFSGSGHTQGVVLSIEPWYEKWGYRFGLEAGAFLHFDTWTEQVGKGIGQLHAPTGLHIAPMAGITVHRGAFSVAYRHYFMNGQLQAENVPPLWKGIDTIEVKYKF